MGFSDLRLRDVFVLSCVLSLGQISNAATIPAATKPTFGDVVPVPGAMTRTELDFQDGLGLDLYSPKPRTLTVRQNMSPLPGYFVTGLNGEPFVALSKYSYIVKMNESAHDLIARVELPYDPLMLKQLGIHRSNTYVGKLAADKESWHVNDRHRNVHKSENQTRIMKKTSLDGEYILLGRKTADSSNIFVKYGYGASRTVNIVGGKGKQVAEFLDGLRVTVEAPSAMKINANIPYGVNPAYLPKGSVSLNSFAWVVNTSTPTAAIEAKLRVPYNRHMLAALNITCSSPASMLTVARRALNDAQGQFLPIIPAPKVSHGHKRHHITVKGLTSLDGQYVILVTAANCSTTAPHGCSSTPKPSTAVASPTTLKLSTAVASPTTTK